MSNIMTPAIGVTSAMRKIMPIRDEIAARQNAEMANSSSASSVPVTQSPYHPGKFVDLKA
jgi:hypothetical protein